MISPWVQLDMINKLNSTSMQVKTLESGEIDYQDLEMRLQKNNGKPAIINVNIGTTVRGAVDDLDRVLEVLSATGYPEDRFFIHCDGALFGLMVSQSYSLSKSSGTACV